MSRLDDDEKKTFDSIEGVIGGPARWSINESGLYNLIIRSNKPEANKFRRWITHEVLPSIRKTGSYQIHPDINTLTRPNKITMSFLAREYNGALRLAKFFGLEGNQATLSANKVIKKQYGPDCMMMMDTQNLICEKQEIHLTATDLGMRLNNISPQQANMLLRSQGFIKSYRNHKNQLHWKPTEKGKPYTILKDVGKQHSDGTPIQQLMYLESILEALESKKALSN